MTGEKKSAPKGAFKGGILGGAALAVIATALVGGLLNRSAAGARSDDAAPMTIDGTYRIVPEAHEEGVEASLGALDPHVMPQPMRQAAAGAALSGLLASMIALFGPNKLLQMMVAFGKRLARFTAKAAEKPIKAAGAAAKATGKAAQKIFKKPGQFVLLMAGLTIFTFTGISLLDIQWQAGLITGAGLAGAAIYGMRKAGKAFGAIGEFWAMEPQKVAT